MGKNAGTRKSGSKPLSQPRASFFSPSSPGFSKAVGATDGDKMAPPEAREEPGRAEPITRSELRADLKSCFAKLEATMLDKFRALMTPLSGQLQEMQQNLTQLRQATDTVMELGLKKSKQL